MESIPEIPEYILSCQSQTALKKINSLMDQAEGKNKEILKFYKIVAYESLGDYESMLQAWEECEDRINSLAPYQFKYAIAQFYNEDFANALINFKKAEESDQVTDEGFNKEVKAWIHKTILEMGNPNVGNINDSVFLDKKVPEKVAEVPVEKPSDLKTLNPEVPLEDNKEAKSIKELTHDWYQNSDYVFLSILKKKLKGEFQVNLSYEHCKVTTPDGQNYVVHLAHSITVDETSYTQNDFKVEIKLKKSESGINWDTLNKEDTKEKAVESIPSYPTSSKKKKNWDNINREVEKEFVKDKPEGDAAMNELLQQIYSGADEDTKRAMIKSYQTSNGTVLSTSWDDVKNKDYEGKDYVSPPDHMEAKKPEI